MKIFLITALGISQTLFADGYIQMNGKKTYLKDSSYPTKKSGLTVTKKTEPPKGEAPSSAQAGTLLKARPQETHRETDSVSPPSLQESSPGFFESLINRGKAKWEQMQKQNPPAQDSIKEIEEQL